MLESLLSWQSVHIVAHLLEFVLPIGRDTGCPACVCNPSEPVIVEKVPEAITSALNFAQQQCQAHSASGQGADSSCWSFSLFWVGVLAGTLLTLGFCVVLSASYRAFQRLVATGRSEETNQPAVQRASSTPRVAALADGEPANPRTLRQLGIVR